MNRFGRSARQCRHRRSLSSRLHTVCKIGSRPATTHGSSRSEEHTSELQSLRHLVCRFLHDTHTTELYTLSLHDALPISVPASPQFIVAVAHGLQNWISARNNTRLIYGGSAGPGLLGLLGASVDGLFLGRFAHDITALAAILREASLLKSPS